MDKTKINAGFIVKLDEEDWRNFEDLVSDNVERLIFVKRCPVTVKLQIREVFPQKGGENNGDISESVETY
jgi:hypothetical protein